LKSVTEAIISWEEKLVIKDPSSPRTDPAEYMKLKLGSLLKDSLEKLSRFRVGREPKARGVFKGYGEW